MATAPTHPRRLLRTKQAAEYLSMSEWKLRRLIQDAIIPFLQDQEGGPFLLDVRDLDAYIDGNKHHVGDSIDWRPIPVASVPAPQTIHSLRRAR
jgi:excisionase family DNA binding protein